MHSYTAPNDGREEPMENVPARGWRRPQCHQGRNQRGREVLLVVHSLRILVASEALKGFTPGPVQLLVIAGHLLDIGQSFVAVVGGTLPPVFEVKVRGLERLLPIPQTPTA